MLRVLLPRALTRIGDVQNATVAAGVDPDCLRRLSPAGVIAPGYNISQHVSDISRVGRRRNFVRYCRDLRTLPRSRDHLIYETRPLRTEHPRNADYQMAIAYRKHRGFTGALGLTVNADRIGLIVFNVRL